MAKPRGDDCFIKEKMYPASVGFLETLKPPADLYKNSKWAKGMGGGGHQHAIPPNTVPK